MERKKVYFEDVVKHLENLFSSISHPRRKRVNLLQRTARSLSSRLSFLFGLFGVFVAVEKGKLFPLCF